MKPEALYALMRLGAAVRRARSSATGLLGRTAAELLTAGLDAGTAAAAAVLDEPVRARWLDREAARCAAHTREELLQALAPRLRWGAGGCRPHLGPLSPGCRICQDGGWACTLVNRRCTRDCDFCKRSHALSAPESDAELAGIAVPTAAHLVAELRTLGITGVGLSGGEPLLVPERLLAYVRAIRRTFGSGLYVWLYTNGDLADDDILRQLGEAGVDEIRFNLAARAYDPAPVLRARRHFPTVTVEIPALPAELEVVTALLPQLAAAGVDHLNLHQLSLERQNSRQVLAQAGRLLVTPAGIALVESELGALTLMRRVLELGLELPVNYCSRTYKDRYQSRGLRRQAARAAAAPEESVTEAGYLRRLDLLADDRVLDRLLEEARRAGVSSRCRRLPGSLRLHPDLLRWVPWSAATLQISYLDASAFRDPARRSGGSALRPRHRLAISPRSCTAAALAGFARAAATADGETAPAQGLRAAVAATADRRRAAPLAAALRYETVDTGLPELA